MDDVNVTPDAVFRRREGLIIMELAGDYLAYPPGTGYIVTLNETAKAILDSCNNKDSVRKIAAHLARKSKGDPDVVLQDTLEGVELLYKEGMIEPAE